MVSKKSSRVGVEAEDILLNGDPVKYLLDTFSEMHKGDYNTAMVLLVAIATQSILNSDGIQPSLSGESGKGKSHVCKTILHMLPKKYWIDSSLSGKAPFYSDFKSGMIVFSDDTTISEELESTIKRATSDFQEDTTHTTVSTNRKGATLTVPKRISWWLANVDTTMSMQALNRQFGVTIDESPEMDDEVTKLQLKKAETGELKYPITDEVLICREILRIIKETLFVVKIPFAGNIVWTGGANRRNLNIFLDILRAFTILRFKQRVVCDDNAIEATIEDYNDATQLYFYRAETQTTKLNDNELKLMHIMAASGDMDSNGLQEIMKKSQSQIYYWMHGRNGKGGLLSKAPELQCEDTAVTVETSSGYKKVVYKKVYSVHGFDILGSYGSTISLKKEYVQSMIKPIVELMKEFKGSKRYYKTERGLSMIRSKLEANDMKPNEITNAINIYITEVKLSK